MAAAFSNLPIDRLALDDALPWFDGHVSAVAFFAVHVQPKGATGYRAAMKRRRD